MANILDKVKTVVLVMFENRSFDHMLGHLSFEGINGNVDGLKAPLQQYENVYLGDSYKPYKMAADVQLPFDLPHEADQIKTQLAKSNVTKKFTMTGFVEAFAKATSTTPNPQSLPMGFFNSKQVPITSFLANTFCTCDRWFSSLPASTQPNRTIAFTGDTKIADSKVRLIDIDDSIFKWMSGKVRWRVYHDGLSFFALYPKLWSNVLGSNFRDYEFLFRDMTQEHDDTAPQVIIVEPSYQDSPHVGSDRPNDNHAPLAIGWGEEFLRRTYEAVSANKARWENTVMIVYYDEHGGFYDHVPPPPIGYTTTGSAPVKFDSLGVRIPGMIVSPLVKPGSVCHELFDHTSVLQFLAEKFTPGKPYSPTVAARSKQGIKSISAALNNDVPFAPPPPPSQPLSVRTVLGKTVATAPVSEMAGSFELAANELIANEPAAVGEKYPELLQWKASANNARK